MIASEGACAASPSTVHALLVDVDTWPLWSPHVASVTAPVRRVEPGWAGATRPFFAPVSTPMVVDEVRPDGGYSWHATLGPWRLDYENRVSGATDGSRVRVVARLSGPAGRVLERIVGPLSAYGQRRRIARLTALAELAERWRG